MNSCYSQNPGLGKVTGTEVMEAFGPSDVYCGLYPLEADVAMSDIHSCHPWRHPLWGTISDGQT